GLHLEVGMKDDLMVNAQRSSLVRAMTNLVDNAFKFGEMAQLSALQHPDEIVIMVDDDGPGMDEADHEEAVKAFGRLDQARNLNMPGSGLGLSIVRDVARAHGGRLDLGTSPLGGLRATISLPLS
ncbi:MAG: ATP-binding protein, partial [Pseudomonadota bacterium]